MALMEQIAGAVLTLVTLLDIFLTVLYARAGTALFSPVVSRAIWLVFRLVSRPFGRNRGRVLSFCGPVILVVPDFRLGRRTGAWVRADHASTSRRGHPRERRLHAARFYVGAVCRRE